MKTGTMPQEPGLNPPAKVIVVGPAKVIVVDQLHLFHSSALSLVRLTDVWSRIVLKLFTPVRVGDSLVCLADGIKVGKEGKKMPAVKKLHQSSGSNTKAPYICSRLAIIC